MTSHDVERSFYIQNEDAPTSIPESVPFTNSRVPTDDILNYFINEPEDVALFTSSKQSEYWARDKPPYLVLSAYFMAILVSLLLAEIGTFPENINQILIVGTFVLIFLIGVAIWAYKKLVQNHANSSGVSYEDAVYHEVSSAIDAYKRGKYEYCIKHLKNLNKLLSFDEESSPFNTKFEEDLKQYTERIENEDTSDFLVDTFPPIGDLLLRYLVIVQSTNFNNLYPEEEDVDITTNYDWRDHLQTFIGGLADNPYVRRIGPYIIIASLVIAIALMDYLTWANIVAILSIGIIEGYHRVKQEES